MGRFTVICFFLCMTDPIGTLAGSATCLRSLPGVSALLTVQQSSRFEYRSISYLYLPKAQGVVSVFSGCVAKQLL